MSEPDYLGLGTSLDAGPSVLLANTAFAHELEAAEYLWSGLDAADQAHLTALTSAGLVDPAIARRLIDGLRQVAAEPLDVATLRPEIGDVYNNRDALLRRRLGADVGWIHLGRARREATTIAWQLACRSRLVELGAALADLESILVETAAANAEALMSDYTYLHRAHPTTLGHYLLAHAHPIGRDIDRVERAFALVNRSPAGSGSVNGSVFPIDRGLLARLLQFGGLVEHTRDAMWAPDMALEPMFVCSTVFTNIDRLAEELQLWTTAEYGYVRLDDRHCRTSVVMPQKRNPYALTWLRGQSRHGSQLLGALMATMQTISGQPDNRTFAYLGVPRTLDLATAATRLLTEVIGAANFDHRRLAEATNSGHSYATDLCDQLTLRHGFDNRTAHRLVGRAIRLAESAGRDRVDPGDVASAGAELGIEVPALTVEELNAIVDPRSIVANRQATGGAGAGPTSAMIAALRSTIESWRTTWRDHPIRAFEQRFAASIDETLEE